MAEFQILKLGVIFLIIITLLGFKRPLYQAMLAGIVATALLYGIRPQDCLRLIFRVCSNWGAMSILVSLYLITFLQRMLEKRGQIKLAQEDLNGLFHNRRVNATGASLFIGLLPSAAAMILCGEIVKDSSDGYLDPKEQAFVASWFRHIPESTLPTYSSVLLMSGLTGVPLPQFMLGMVVPLVVLFLLGYLPYLRKLPKDPGTPHSLHKFRDLQNLIRHLWTLLAILLLILVFKLSVTTAVVGVILLGVAVYRFHWRELKPMFASAFEHKLLLNTLLVLVLKEFIGKTGVLQALPSALSVLPIPMYLVFALMFFVGTVISGSNGIIALGAPMAFAAIPGSGMPLMVLLMCMCHAASQLSPTHVCLLIASDYFGITLGDLVRKTLPVALMFCALMVGYYQMLLMLF